MNDSNHLICFVKEAGTFYKIDTNTMTVVLGVEASDIKLQNLLCICLSPNNKYLALAGSKS
jgi:hypothetical protein